jgi:hypothetical protein
MRCIGQAFRLDLLRVRMEPIPNQRFATVTQIRTRLTSGCLPVIPACLGTYRLQFPYLADNAQNPRAQQIVKGHRHFAITKFQDSLLNDTSKMLFDEKTIDAELR